MRKRLSKWMFHLWLIVAILPLRLGASEPAWIAQPPRDHLFKAVSFVALQSPLQQTSNVISRIQYQGISPGMLNAGSDDVDFNVETDIANLGAFKSYPIPVQQFLPVAQYAMLNSTTIVNSDFDEDHQGYFSYLAEKGVGDWVLPILVVVCLAIVLLLIGCSGLYCLHRLSSSVLIVFTLVITWFLVALYRDGEIKDQKQKVSSALVKLRSQLEGSIYSNITLLKGLLAHMLAPSSNVRFFPNRNVRWWLNSPLLKTEADYLENGQAHESKRSKTVTNTG